MHLKLLQKEKKKAEATVDLIENKIAEKIVKNGFRKSKNSLMSTQTEELNNAVQIPKQRYILSRKRQRIIDKFTVT